MSQDWTHKDVLARPFDATELINQLLESAHANRKKISELFDRVELMSQAADIAERNEIAMRAKLVRYEGLIQKLAALDLDDGNEVTDEPLFCLITEARSLKEKL